MQCSRLQWYDISVSYYRISVNVDMDLGVEICFCRWSSVYWLRNLSSTKPASTSPCFTTPLWTLGTRQVMMMMVLMMLLMMMMLVLVLKRRRSALLPLYECWGCFCDISDFLLQQADRHWLWAIHIIAGSCWRRGCLLPKSGKKFPIPYYFEYFNQKYSTWYSFQYFNQAKISN